jgi:CubicO group peptidase (beta-lactamase class C family)
MNARLALLAICTAWLPAQQPQPAPTPAPTPVAPAPVAVADRYVPPTGDWPRSEPRDLGFDADKLAAAIAFAQKHATDWPKDFRDQQKIFGRLLGPMPKTRADTNGVIVRRGRLVATFGDVTAVDPTYSVAKSLLATVTAIAVRDARIADLDEPVGKRVTDGGYAAPNDSITWRHHLQQESEWQGDMFGKDDRFLEADEFGQGMRRPRERKQPGTFYEYNDVRINRFALSLLRVFGKPVPDVLAAEVMQPIGASDTWRWIPYDNAMVEVDGKPMPSVSGGTRWGGGVRISALDLARLGLLWQRGGAWGDRQLLPPAFMSAALTPSAHGPDYGFLFWLNSKQKNWPGLPRTCFGARGAGSNTVFVSPEHELVIVWRWHATGDAADAQFFKMVVDAIER